MSVRPWRKTSGWGPPARGSWTGSGGKPSERPLRVETRPSGGGREEVGRDDATCEIRVHGSRPLRARAPTVARPVAGWSRIASMAPSSLGPGVEVLDPQPRPQIPEHLHRRVRLAGRLQDPRHQIETRVVLLQRISSSRAAPGQGRHRRSGGAASFRNRSWLTTSSGAGETLRQRPGVRKRGEHVGAEEEHHAHAALTSASVTRDICRHAGRRAAAGRGTAMSGERLPLAGTRRAGGRGRPRHSEVPGERRKAADRPRALPAAAALAIEFPPIRIIAGRVAA